MTVKKLYIILAVTMIGLIFSFQGVYAAFYQFTPAQINVVAGQTFNVTVALNPEGIKNYTAKLEAHFPANLLQVNSFTFSGNWMAVNTPGNNTIDNTNGILVKTAGYPSGTSSQTTFGVISFTAKAQGNASIIVDGANSMVLGAGGENLLTNGSNQAIATIAIPPAVLSSQTSASSPSSTSSLTPDTTGPAPSSSQDNTSLTPAPSTQTETQPGLPESNNSAASVSGAAQAGLLPVVMNVLSLGTQQTWLAIVVLLIILAAIWWGINYWQMKRKKPSVSINQNQVPKP